MLPEQRMSKDSLIVTPNVTSTVFQMDIPVNVNRINSVKESRGQPKVAHLNKLSKMATFDKVDY